MTVKGYDVGTLLKKTWQEIGEDKVPVYAAQMAYNFFFSLFPLLLVFAALLGMIADKQQVMGWFNGPAMAALPSGVAGLLRETIAAVVFAKGAPGLLSFGLLAAVWSGSAIFGSFRDALNAAYEVTERRPWWQRYLFQLGALLVAGVVVVAATVVLLNGEGVVRWIGDRVGLGHAFVTAWTILQFPIAIAALVLLLWLLYLYLPNCRHQGKKYVLVAAIVATVLWLAATLLFRLYVQKFHSMNPAYGAVGAIMVLLTRMYYSSFDLLAAGELSAELQAGTGRVKARATRATSATTARERRSHQASDARVERVAPVALTAAAARRAGIVRLLGDMVRDGAVLVKRELAMARVEMAAMVRGISRGTAMVATGGVLALLGALSAISGIILLVGDQWLPQDRYWLAAVIGMLLALPGAVIFARHGLALLPPSRKMTRR
ncbi:MAG: YihY family inner membrane protein [Gemmatimonadaceae bacterium]|nr:YihY family inner membrane protein [Gemmatimonadaceae bacterium]